MKKNPTSNKYAGRTYQTYIANLFGGKSVGTIEGQDVEHPIFSIECKKRKGFVAVKWMDQCIKNCPKKKTPLVLVHVTKEKHERDLVIIMLKDFKKLHADILQEKPILRRRNKNVGSKGNRKIMRRDV